MIKIIDENGNDVTPKPLFEVEASKPRHTSSIFHSMEGTNTVIYQREIINI
jgi:hypothetical protein